MDVVNVFKYLQLHLINDDWVQQVWDSDFMELDELTSEYEEFLMENDALNLLETVNKVLRTSLDVDKTLSSEGQISDDNTVSWEFLVENKIELKNLLAILCYFMTNGQKSSDMKSIELCIKATSLYFLLVTLPGCDAFFVFQPSIYEKTLKTLAISNMLNETKSVAQPRGRKKTTDGNDDDSGDEYNSGKDDDEMSFQNLPPQSKIYIRKSLNNVLKDLYFMIKRYPLKVEDCLEKTIVQLVSHTRLSCSSVLSDFGTLRINGDVSSFVCNSYTLLRKLCTPLHGKEKKTVRLIFYHLLSNILMAGEFFKDVSMHHLNVIRLQTEKFILYLQKCLDDIVYPGMCIFIQHLCARVTDKADYRLKVSQSIVSLLNVLPSEPYFRTIKWLLRFAHDIKASHRLFALEVISKLLYEDERPNDNLDRRDSTSTQPRQSVDGEEEVHEEEEDERLESQDISRDESNTVQPERDVASHKYLLGVLFSRCHDQSGTVRTKALSTLTDCLRTNNKVIVELMKEIFVTPYEDNNLIDNENIIERGFLNTKIFLESLDKPAHVQADPLPGGKAVVIELLNLVEDDKVFVRKAAFSLLESIVRINHKWLNEKLLKVISDHVRDPALLIKKQLIQSMTDLLLLYPDDGRLAKCYIDAVLPQISHPELKVQEKVQEALQSTLLQRLVPFEKLDSPLSYLPWTLLQLIIDLKKRKFFQITCSMWSKSNMFPKNLLSLIKTHIDTKHNVAAWLFLSCVAPYVQIKNPEFIVEYYRDNLMNSEKSVRYAVVKALDVLGHAWKHLPVSEQNIVRGELLESVRKMRLCTTLIGPVLDVLLLITLGQAPNVKAGQEEVIEWSKRIFTKIDEYFQQHSPLQNDGKRVNMEEFMRNLVTLGDIAQLCPGHIPNNIGIILTGILFPEKLHDPVKWSVPGLQALTVVTLGKMCLQNETLAKRIVPAMGLLLADSKHEAVKVNVMNALSDMCIRFTAVVEPLLPEMCVCLKDNNVVVRHHTVTVFVRLLQQDFLKLRGALLFHMMSMLVDPYPNISNLANYFMTQCVVTRNKSIMYQNIVDSIFYYNKYENHPAYSKIKLSAQEAILFNMTGSDNEPKRHTLYRFMCEHMSDEQRMQAIHKICVDVLGGVSNETVVLDDKGESVLRDAFFILQCDEICLHSLRAQSEDEPATDDAERVTAAVNTAKKNIISQCVKKQVVEIIIPIIMQLKSKLQTVMSPLLTNLMSYLRNLLKDYKNEIEEIFSEDKTLAEEILFDMKKFEEEEKNRAQSQDSDEEDGGEVDHMRPLLVELATDHLRKSMRRGNSGPSQGSELASPRSVEVPVGSPENRNCSDKSPSSAGPQSPCTDNSPADPKSPMANGKSVGEVTSNDETPNSSLRGRRRSTAEKGIDGEESNVRPQTPSKSQSQGAKKRTFEETLLEADNYQTPSGRRSASVSKAPRNSVSPQLRKSSRSQSTDSRPISPASTGDVSDSPVDAGGDTVRRNSRKSKQNQSTADESEGRRSRRSVSSSRKSSVASENSSGSGDENEKQSLVVKDEPSGSQEKNNKAAKAPKLKKTKNRR